MMFLAFLEILVLFFLFLLLRRLLVQLFRVSKLKLDLSEESYHAMRRYQKRYYRLLLLLTVLFSILAFGLLDFAVLQYHAHYSGSWRLSLKPSSLWLPALLVGLSLSTQVAAKINDYLQKDGLGFYLVELQEWREGFSFRRLWGWHFGLSTALITPLMYAQFAMYLELNESHLVVKSDFGPAALLAHGHWQLLTVDERPAVSTEAGDSLYLDAFRIHPVFMERLAQKSSP